ncbi:hypothetical protein [Streptomyces benahoarensis]|uniref:Uncharacterized protein n=1 Tax=Streptomyces benahoarensis TaxID=2595054 RepID=A0A553Y2T9_9ACTN|nr:hypothetical protein [Streptomyces benahoarensis]TSB23078.1 hypothetical protein FNJ62_15600 [Streptomyces benahoarensis]TSB23545.1 hypothetical protein FNZ23_27540 [Streptomyces benahoarensis]
MATNPQNQAEGNYDPAGSTQMFRAFVDEGGTPQTGGRRAPAPAQSAGPRIGLIVGIAVAVVVVAAAVWLAVA